MNSPLDILTSTAKPAAKPARVDADTFAKLCERPDAQRFIIDGGVHGVMVGSECYTLADYSAINAYEAVRASRARAAEAVEQAAQTLHNARKDLAGLELLLALVEPAYRVQIAECADLLKNEEAFDDPTDNS